MITRRPTGQVFLTGLSGAGKSTIGEKLAAQLDREFIDSDALIVTEENLSIRKIFDSMGEERFRAIEAKAIEQIVATGATDAIVALGGGALLSTATRKLIAEKGDLIYLKVTCESAAERLLACDNRPLTLRDNQVLSQADLVKRLQTLLDSRIEGYSAANHVVKVSSRSIDDICQDISNYLKQK